MTRIRYSKVDGKLVSKGNIMAKTELVEVVIDPTNLTFLIRTVGGSSYEITQGGGDTLHLCKSLAKGHLKKIGVVFEDEVRNKTVTSDTNETVGEDGLEEMEHVYE